MSEELARVAAEEGTDDVVLVADNPSELQQLQVGMISAMGGKIARAVAEVEDGRRTMDALVAAGMDTRAADRNLKRAESRLDFLKKCLSALRDGYVIVPEMPHNVVAIRVKRGPRRQHERNPYGRIPTINTEGAPGLPEGEGSYADPLPASEIRRFENTDPATKKTEVVVHRTTTGWDEIVGLPVTFLKPAVVERTGRCMMRKLFDEIAVVGADKFYVNRQARKADPMVLGSVVDRVTKRRAWFLVAWFVDTADL